jgi:hypothetical protein
MRFMNEYEIDASALRWSDHPVLGPATATLQNLMVAANENSDGWAYWPKPCRAAAGLQELVERANLARLRFDREYSEPTAEDLKRALRPVKAFRTRSKLPFEIEEV